MDKVKQLFGQRIKFLRKTRHMTQEQLAERLGLNVRQISRIESGVNFVSLDTMKMLSVIFNVNISELFNISITPDEILLSCKDKILHYTAVDTDKGTKFTKTGDSDSFYIKNFVYDKKDESLSDIAKKCNHQLTVSYMKNNEATADIIYFPNGDFKVYKRQNFFRIDYKLTKLFNEIIKISKNELMLDFIKTAVNACRSLAARKRLRILLDGLDLADKMK